MTTIEKDKLRIFVSRKEEDHDLARRIVKRLALFAGDQVEFCTSMNVPEGKDWRKRIEKTLNNTDLLILLFTHPSYSWDWCLYEAGLFTSLESESKKPVVCIHTVTSLPPGPLQHIQSVKADIGPMKQFLKRLYGTTEITGSVKPINRAFADDDEALSKAAEQICGELETPEDSSEAMRFHYNRRIVLMVDPRDLEAGSIPDATQIQADRMTLEIFGLLDDALDGGKWTWGELLQDMLKNGDNKWLQEVNGCITNACNGRYINPISETLSSLTSNKIYQPNLSRRWKMQDGKMRLEILLIQQPAEGDKNITYPVADSGDK